MIGKGQIKTCFWGFAMVGDALKSEFPYSAGKIIIVL